MLNDTTYTRFTTKTSIRTNTRTTRKINLAWGSVEENSFFSLLFSFSFLNAVPLPFASCFFHYVGGGGGLIRRRETAAQCDSNLVRRVRG